MMERKSEMVRSNCNMPTCRFTKCGKRYDKYLSC